MECRAIRPDGVASMRLRSFTDCRSSSDQCWHVWARGTSAEQFLILALELCRSVQVGGRVANHWLMVLKGSSTISAERFLVLARDLSLSVQACVQFRRVSVVLLWYCLLPGFTHTTGFICRLWIPSTAMRLTQCAGVGVSSLCLCHVK
jgi:hypothetical protein